MDALPFLAIGLVSVLGTFGWLAVAIGSLWVALRLPVEVRAEVPLWVWVPFGASIVLSVVWPLGLMASLIAVCAGGAFAATRQAPVRQVGLASVAAGGAYLALLTAITVSTLLALQVTNP